MRITHVKIQVYCVQERNASSLHGRNDCLTESEYLRRSIEIRKIFYETGERHGPSTYKRNDCVRLCSSLKLLWNAFNAFIIIVLLHHYVNKALQPNTKSQVTQVV